MIMVKAVIQSVSLPHHLINMGHAWANRKLWFLFIHSLPESQWKSIMSTAVFYESLWSHFLRCTTDWFAYKFCRVFPKNLSVEDTAARQQQVCLPVRGNDRNSTRPTDGRYWVCGAVQSTIFSLQDCVTRKMQYSLVWCKKKVLTLRYNTTSAIATFMVQKDRKTVCYSHLTPIKKLTVYLLHSYQWQHKHNTQRRKKCLPI